MSFCILRIWALSRNIIVKYENKNMKNKFENIYIQVDIISCRCYNYTRIVVFETAQNSDARGLIWWFYLIKVTTRLI